MKRIMFKVAQDEISLIVILIKPNQSMKYLKARNSMKWTKPSSVKKRRDMN